MRVLKKIYKHLFSRADNSGVVFSFFAFSLCLCTLLYTSLIQCTIAALAILLTPFFLFKGAQKYLIAMFIIGALSSLWYFEPLWLDFVFALNLLCFILCTSTNQALLGESYTSEGERKKELETDLGLYKKRFDTLVSENQKILLQKEDEKKELKETLALQKERLQKLEEIVKLQETKCIQVGGQARKLQQEIEKERQNSALFEQHCKNFAEKINDKAIKPTKKKVALLALRKQGNNSKKIELTDLAKSFKG